MTDPNPSVQPGDPLGPPQAPSRQRHTGRTLAIVGGVTAALVVLAVFLDATTDFRQSLIGLFRPSASVGAGPEAGSSPASSGIDVTCTLDPKTPRPGTIATLTYAITSDREVTVGLGVDISRDVDEKGISDDNSYATDVGDVDSYQIHVGENPPKSRPVEIPAHLPPGDYTVTGEVWPADKIGDDDVEAYDDADCAAFTVR
jgi:hypothetical protein